MNGKEDDLIDYSCKHYFKVYLPPEYDKLVCSECGKIINND